MIQQKVITVITAITGDRVIVCEASLRHALAKHFPFLPQEMFLELLVMVLKDPTEVYADNSRHPRKFQLFYRLDNQKYLVAIVKTTMEGSFLSSLYPTGSKIRATHQHMKRIKL